MLRRFPLYLALCIFAYFTLILWAFRATLSKPFDPVYWKDKYEHSQWKLPLSTRTLGDDGLYLYEGYRLISGDDPTTLNAEVPPLGKYLIGWTLKTLGNPAWYGFIITSSALLIWSWLIFRLTRNRLSTLIFLLLFAADPLIARQFPLTMLDSLHLLTLGGFFLGLTINSPFISAVIAGTFLGLFSQTKAPLLSPLLFLIGSVYIWKKFANYRALILFTFATSLAYLLPYLRYFTLGHSILEWLGVQKWIWNFYAQSKLTANTGSLWTTLITNNYQNLSSRAWERISEWSFSWPLLTLTFVITNFYLWTQKKFFELPLTALTKLLFSFSLLMAGIYTFIPFWSRYLLLLLPFLYYSCILILPKFSKFISFSFVSLILAFNLISSFQIIFPTPEPTLHQALYDWQHGFFQDLYEHISQTNQTQISRADFHRKGLTFLNNAQIESISINLPPITWTRAPKESLPLEITYYTRHLGPFPQKTILPIINENGVWKISWSWDLLLTGLTADSSPLTQVDLGKRGDIIASDKTILAADVPGFLIWVTPNQIKKSQEDALLKTLERLFHLQVKAIAIHERLVGNSLGDQPIPLGVIPTPQIIDLQGYTAVTLTPAYFRQYQENNPNNIGAVANSQFFECCSRLYNTTTYSGISGLEKNQDNVLKGENGGSLTLVDKGGNLLRTLIQKNKHNGQNVQL